MRFILKYDTNIKETNLKTLFYNIEAILCNKTLKQIYPNLRKHYNNNRRSKFDYTLFQGHKMFQTPYIDEFEYNIK